MILRRVLAASAVVGLASSATACPTCSTGQGLETLVYVLAFMTVPYVVVSGVLFCVRRVLSQERGL